MRRLILMMILAASADVSIAGGVQPFSNLRIEPASPRAGQSISLVATWFGCGAVGTPSVHRADAVVEIIQPYSANCGVPRPPADIGVALGALAAGNYVARFVPCSGDDAATCVPEAALADVPFTVTGSVPAAVAAPTVGWIGLMLTALGLALFGLRAARTRAFADAGERT